MLSPKRKKYNYVTLKIANEIIQNREKNQKQEGETELGFVKIGEATLPKISITSHLYKVKINHFFGIICF